jgi:VWFA-related protein
MKSYLLALGGFLLSFGALAAWGQNQPGSAPEQAPVSTIRATSQEVVLDMVFRDKKGKAIRDIKPEEIHIAEDGSDQKMTSFRMVDGKTIQPLSGDGATPLDPMREIRLVTLVFEGLDNEGKRFFRQAVKDILDTSPEQNLFYSVLTIDQKLHCIQPFTSDHAELLKNLEKSEMWSFIQYSTQSAQIKASLKQTLSGDEPQLQGSSGPGGGGPTASQIGGMVTWRMAKLQYDMLEAADSADREYNARATMDALMSLVRAQAQLPGRKVVLYFNPWLQITEAVKEQYQNLIGAANRANVSIYTVDPKGLVTWSQGSSGRDMLSGAAKEIRDNQMKGGVGEVSTQQARAGENAEAALRANPLMWLRDLAQQTGGAAIAETNDYRAPLRAAMDEVRTYYEAAYVPRISTYDGSFRKISVRVDRPNVVVHTRSGYFALPQLKGGQQLNAYEMPLLNALNATPAATEVAFRAAAERFNDHGPKVEYMITLEAPLSGLSFTPQPDKKTASVDAALLAVLKDSSGEIVEKFNKNFAVQVDINKVDAYKSGNLLQTFRTELAPGTYRLEAVVMDRNANRLGVSKSVVSAPQPSTKLTVSNVVVVRRTDPVKDGQMTDAFYFPGGKVVPSLTDTLKGGPGNVLPFYFAVYPDRSVQAAPTLTMGFYKDGQYLGAAQSPLPEVQKDGRIPFIANLPADKFAPGAYEIHIDVAQGASKAEEKVAFKVE